MGTNDKGYYDIDIELDKALLDNGMIEEIFYLKDLKQRKLFLNVDVDQFSVAVIVTHIMLYNADYVWATDNVYIKSLFKPKKMWLRNAAINYAQQEHKVYYSSSSPLKFEKTK